MVAPMVDCQHNRDDGMAVEAPLNESLKSVSINRLACLIRHWTRADEAKVRFDRELALGWEYDEDPRADHCLVPITTGVRCCAASPKPAFQMGFCRSRSSRRWARTSRRACLCCEPAKCCYT